MKISLGSSLVVLLISIGSTCAYADAQMDELMKVLTTPLPEYQLDTQPYVIDPKIAQRQYEVTWLIPPVFRVTQQQYKGYKQPVRVEMTVEAGTGRIVHCKTLKSSGSIQTDQKVHEALHNAKLQVLPMVEKTMRYTLEHHFVVNPPL